MKLLDILSSAPLSGLNTPDMMTLSPVMTESIREPFNSHSMFVGTLPLFILLVTCI